MLKPSAQHTKGGGCRNFAYYFMLIILSWRTKRGGMAKCPPPKYAPASDVSHLLHNSFLMLLSSISSSFFNGILSLFTILALIWGLVLTFMIFIGLYKRLKSKVKPRWSHFRSRFTKARKPTVSGEVIEEQNMNTKL